MALVDGEASLALACGVVLAGIVVVLQELYPCDLLVLADLDALVDGSLLILRQLAKDWYQVCELCQAQFRAQVDLLYQYIFPVDVHLVLSLVSTHLGLLRALPDLSVDRLLLLVLDGFPLANDGEDAAVCATLHLLFLLVEVIEVSFLLGDELLLELGTHSVCVFLEELTCLSANLLGGEVELLLVLEPQPPRGFLVLRLLGALLATAPGSAVRRPILLDGLLEELGLHFFLLLDASIQILGLNGILVRLRRLRDLWLLLRSLRFRHLCGIISILFGLLRLVRGEHPICSISDIQPVLRLQIPEQRWGQALSPLRQPKIGLRDLQVRHLT